MSVVVAFVSKKGGVGKSTLARALTAVLARRGLLTTLGDLDSEQQTAIRWQSAAHGHEADGPVSGILHLTLRPSARDGAHPQTP